ncbi:hypothetical protein PG988_012016 [Apiospora saccharicola]
MEHNITETELLRTALGASLAMDDITVLFKSTVSRSLERPSPFVQQGSGRATAFEVYVDGQGCVQGVRKYFHSLTLCCRIYLPPTS